MITVSSSHWYCLSITCSVCILLFLSEILANTCFCLLFFVLHLSQSDSLAAANQCVFPIKVQAVWSCYEYNYLPKSKFGKQLSLFQCFHITHKCIHCLFAQYITMWVLCNVSVQTQTWQQRSKTCQIYLNYRGRTVIKCLLLHWYICKDDTRLLFPSTIMYTVITAANASYYQI